MLLKLSSHILKCRTHTFKYNAYEAGQTADSDFRFAQITPNGSSQSLSRVISNPLCSPLKSYKLQFPRLSCEPGWLIWTGLRKYKISVSRRNQFKDCIAQHGNYS